MHRVPARASCCPRVLTYDLRGVWPASTRALMLWLAIFDSCASGFRRSSIGSGLGSSREGCMRSREDLTPPRILGKAAISTRIPRVTRIACVTHSYTPRYSYEDRISSDIPTSPRHTPTACLSRRIVAFYGVPWPCCFQRDLVAAIIA